MDDPVFEYSEEDFIISGNGFSSKKTYQLTQFDEIVRKKWTDAMDKGYFRYTLNTLTYRVTPGKYGFLLQLNPQRGITRRKPEEMVNLNMPFNPDKFNFTKVDDKEILFQLKAKETSHTNCVINSQREGRHIVMINVSPLEFGHILLVPNIDCGLPQRLTEQGLRCGLEMMLLSGHPGFRVGFNSLCALASVNHQHVHGWYLDSSVFAEYAKVKKVCLGVYETTDLVAKAFTFQLHGTSIKDLVRTVYKVMDYMQQNEIAHNLFMTRGVQFGQEQGSPDQTVRIYLWPRKSVTGVKNEEGVNVFNVAVAELAGHIPVYVADRFETLTEEEVIEKIQEDLFSDEEFDKFRKDVISLFTDEGS